MEGITLPHGGQWKEANVKSLIVHHPSAGANGNTNKEVRSGRYCPATSHDTIYLGNQCLKYGG